MTDEKKGRNWVQLAGLLIIIILAVVDVLLIQQNRKLKAALSPAPMEFLKPGDRVDAFTVQALDGQFEEIQYVDSAKKCLLFVLSTTCPHCHKNLDAWNSIAEHTRGSGFTILGVSVQSLDRTKKYRDTTKIDFNLTAVNDTSFAQKYKIRSVPVTVLITGGGTVEKTWVGELSKEQTDEIQGLLGGSKALTN